MKIVMITCAAIGLVTVAATIAVGHVKSERATEEFGKRLMTGFLPHRLACASCHIDAGAEPGDLSLADAIAHYPRIEERIDKCVTENMNGRALREDGDEMKAMIGWLRFLGAENAAMGASQRQSHDPPAFRKPSRAADPKAGENLFEKRCADCHGKDGAGLPAALDPEKGYLFPPLWGTESFPDASEMNDPSTLARFIKAKMPLGRADLDDEQAWDIAAFVASKPRPRLAR